MKSTQTDSTHTRYQSLFRTWETWGTSTQRHAEKLRPWVSTLMLLGFIITVLAMITFAIMGIRQWNYNLSKNSCAQKEIKTLVNTEFVTLGYWNYGCYVRMPDGTLVPYGKLRVTLHD